MAVTPPQKLLGRAEDSLAGGSLSGTRSGSAKRLSLPALRERYDRRQQEVVTTAADLFARRGFQATSMDELSEATGLRSGGLYHYIGSKQNLLLLIFEALMGPLLERAADIEASDAQAETQLRGLVRAWLAHIETHLDHMAVFAQERHTI